MDEHEEWFNVLCEDVEEVVRATWHPGTAAFPVGCPLCGEPHWTCRFGPGSLVCVRPQCRNPHHRKAVIEFPF